MRLRRVHRTMNPVLGSPHGTCRDLGQSNIVISLTPCKQSDYISHRNTVANSLSRTEVFVPLSYSVYFAAHVLYKLPGARLCHSMPRLWNSFNSKNCTSLMCANGIQSSLSLEHSNSIPHIYTQHIIHWSQVVTSSQFKTKSW